MVLNRSLATSTPTIATSNPPSRNSAVLFREKSATRRFRRVIRKVIQVSRWKQKGDETLKDSQHLNEDLRFNVNFFKVDNVATKTLSTKSKYLLMKETEDRTKEDIELIYSAIKSIQFFQKYSHSVRMELARVMKLETFEKGRVIVKEGHNGLSMYFIINGCVVVQVEHIDKDTGALYTFKIGELSSGSTFGQLALVHECKRTESYICKETTQFLRIDKEDFDNVLKVSERLYWDERLTALRDISFFNKWNQNHLNHISLYSSLWDYEPGSMVLGNKSAESNEFIYFVVSGTCHVVKKIKLLETRSIYEDEKRVILSLPSDVPVEDKFPNTTTVANERFFVIGALEKGDFFGLGENMESTSIVAHDSVTCILVQRQIVASLERLVSSSASSFGSLVTLKDMKKTAQERILSEEDAFNKWMVGLKWKNYKKQIVNEVISHRYVPEHYSK